MQINRKGFIHVFLLILILLIGFAGIGYFVFKNEQVNIPSNQKQAILSPAPTITKVDISNWKTYRNEEYGFGFKYPNGWSYSTTKNEPWEFNIALKPNEFANYKGGLVTVSIYKGNDIDNYINSVVLCDDPPCPKEAHMDKTEVNKIRAKRVLPVPGPLPSESVILTDNSKIFDFNLSYLDKSYDPLSEKERRQIFDQILTTFRFIE